jgi:ATP-dependent Lhr-like helicase
LLTRPKEGFSEDEAVEEWAWQLLRRWGVVFRDIALREPLAPPWWQLLRAYRRLEARGELRGGRFIRGVGGEQFAASEAIRQLRALREPHESSLLIISASDPLNLTGVIGGGMRIPALATHQIACLGGRVVGWKKAEESWVSSDLSVSQRQLLAWHWGLGGVETEASTQSDRPRRKKRRKPAARSGVPKPFPF